jgi:citrate lyase synthetase
MSTNPKDIDFDEFDIDDSDPDNLFTSPNAKSKSKAPTEANATPVEPFEVNRGRMQESRLSAEESREAALRQELENVRKMNEVLEGVYSSLEKAKNNMEVMDLLRH